MKIFKIMLLAFVMLPSLLFAQLQVSGTVTDENNVPLPGASVIIKGTTKGVVTNLDGEFSLTLEETPKTLIISFIGLKSQEIIIQNQTVITVVLETNQNNLDEIVVIGYGQVERGDVTGSVNSIKPKEDALQQNLSVEDLLQGRSAGVLAQATGSNPNAPTSVQIRGRNSLTGNTQPLYVIDGIIIDSATEETFDPLSGGSSYLAPQGGINGINPRDIESIEVLKDASATAIYGSRGANGVIIITTKKGKKGNAKFNFVTTTTIGSVTNNIDVLDTRGYIDYQNEERENRGFMPDFYVYPDGSFALFQNSEEFMLENSETIERLEGVDWSEDTYRNSLIRNYRLSASGGSDTSDYYISGGYLKNEGIVPRSFAERIDFNLNLNNDLNERLKLSTKFAVEISENSASSGTNNLGGTNNSLIRQVVSGAPILNLTDNFFGDEFAVGLDGPRAWISDYDDLSNELRLLGRLKLDYKISDVFTYRVLFGGDFRKKERKRWYGTGIRRGAQANGEAGIATLDRFRYNLDNTLMFKKRFNKNHRIDGTIGVVLDQTDISRTTNQASDFANKELRADGISTGNVFQPIFLNDEGETLLSFIGRVNYNYRKKYLLTATFRADGSSKFAEGERFSYFPAFAFAWKLNEESFMQKFENLSNAKVRLSYGLTGNQGIPNYRYLTPYGPTASPYADANNGALNAIVPNNLANPNLTWETTTQYNAGVDLGFFDERISVIADVYYKEISDLLLNVEIGPSTGFENFFANQGDLINKGIEFSMNADVIKTDKFRWNVYGNISFNKNEIKNLGLPLSPFGTETYSAFLGRQVSGGNFFKVPANIYIEGEAPGLFYGFETNGIVSNGEQLAQAPTFNGQPAQLGDVFLVDQNGDGNINDTDLTIIGDPNPDYNYGFGTVFEYGNFSLSGFFSGVQGNDIANANLLREAYADSNSNNIRTEAFQNAWRPDNPNGTFPRVAYDLADETGFTDRLVEDGSYLRLNYVTLGYNVPVDRIKHIDNLYFSISGQNLWLLTDYSGFDPEVDSFAFDSGRIGIDSNSFPNQKSFSFSVNVSF